MRVNLAMAIFLEKITGAIEAAVAKGKMSTDAEPTIWFMKQVNEWYLTVTGCSIKHTTEDTKKNFWRKQQLINNFS